MKKANSSAKERKAAHKRNSSRGVRAKKTATLKAQRKTNIQKAKELAVYKFEKHMKGLNGIAA